jgi:hypothetical protein
MNEKHKDKDLNTKDSAVVIEKEPNGRKDMTMSERTEGIETPVMSQVTRETHIEAQEKPIALLSEDEVSDFQSCWNAIQTGFVDEPRSAVEDADGLVAEIMGRLTDIFAEELVCLEDQWTHSDDISTEQLRLTLQRYRSFFHRLLSL